MPFRTDDRRMYINSFPLRSCFESITFIRRTSVGQTIFISKQRFRKITMHFPLSFTASAITILLTSLVSTSNACAPPVNASEAFQLGTDGPADPATLGYSLNHFGILVNDIEESVHFYTKVLGMRHVFTFHATPTYEIVYLSYSQGGSNGTGFQTGEALFAQKTNTEGQLELIYNKKCGDGSNSSIPATTQQESTFSHVGLIVPDITSTQKRMEEFKVPILKKVGEDFKPKDEPAGAKAFGFGGDVQQARLTVRQLTAIGFDQFLIVTDPDGNVVEIQPQV